MNKISGIGVSVLTIFSIASLSSNAISNSPTLNLSNNYYNEAISLINDDRGDLCLSSDLSEHSMEDVLIENNEDEEKGLLKHKRKAVKMQITGVKKYISKFDFEEEYEEI